MECKNCDQRRVGCHSVCESYKAFCERNAEIAEKRRLERIAAEVEIARKVKRLDAGREIQKRRRGY